MVEVHEAPTLETANGQGQASAVAPRQQAAPKPQGGSPFTFIRQFAEQMDQLFEDFGLESERSVPSFLTLGWELLRRETGLVPADWSGRVDVLQSNGRFVVRADLSGVSNDELDVGITNDLLTIRGERKQEKRDGYYYRGCGYGSFYRAIPLPEGTDVSKATAEFRNGVLEVVMPAPRLSAPKARRLEIKEGK